MISYASTAAKEVEDPQAVVDSIFECDACAFTPQRVPTGGTSLITKAHLATCGSVGLAPCQHGTQARGKSCDQTNSGICHGLAKNLLGVAPCAELEACTAADGAVHVVLRSAHRLREHGPCHVAAK